MAIVIEPDQYNSLKLGTCKVGDVIYMVGIYDKPIEKVMTTKVGNRKFKTLTTKVWQNGKESYLQMSDGFYKKMVEQKIDGCKAFKVLIGSSERSKTGTSFNPMPINEKNVKVAERDAVAKIMDFAKTNSIDVSTIDYKTFTETLEEMKLVCDADLAYEHFVVMLNDVYIRKRDDWKSKNRN